MKTAVLKRVPERERHHAIETIRRDYASGRPRNHVGVRAAGPGVGDGFLFVAAP